METKNKSGRATKDKLVKGAQLVDCDYRGNYRVHLFNLSDNPVTIKKGEKVAQVVIRPVWLGLPIEAEISADTPRGENGFGSTGLT
jgi:dUTP pyrophosphatase